MQTVTYSDARENLNAVLDDRAPTFITRQRGENVVMIAASEWAAMKETLHPLASPANARHLLEGIARLDAGGGEEHDRTVKVTFDRAAWADHLAWAAHDPKGLARINTPVEECRRTSFTGTGKPEPLRQSLAGWWSRRITGEHRLTYRVRGSGEARAVEVLSCRYYYRSQTDSTSALKVISFE